MLQQIHYSQPRRRREEEEKTGEERELLQYYPPRGSTILSCVHVSTGFYKVIKCAVEKFTCLVLEAG